MKIVTDMTEKIHGKKFDDAPFDEFKRAPFDAHTHTHDGDDDYDDDDTTEMNLKPFCVQ